MNIGIVWSAEMLAHSFHVKIKAFNNIHHSVIINLKQ